MRINSTSADNVIPSQSSDRGTGIPGGASTQDLRGPLAELSSPSPQPFGELLLGDTEIAQKAESIKRKGYATVRISPATKQFLESSDKSADNWRNKYGWPEKDFIGTDYEKAVTDTASRLVSALRGTPSQRPVLVPKEFQIRHPAGNGADSWHKDGAPKKLVCLATLSGTGTEFVKAGDATRCFEQEQGIGMKPKDGADLGTSVKRAKADRFYLFAARGLEHPEVPKLVHRSPSEPNRSIFMARWK